MYHHLTQITELLDKISVNLFDHTPAPVIKIILNKVNVRGQIDLVANETMKLFAIH